MVADASRRATIGAIARWKVDLDAKAPDVPVVALINKSDLLEGGALEEAAAAELDRVCAQFGIKKWSVLLRTA